MLPLLNAWGSLQCNKTAVLHRRERQVVRHYAEKLCTSYPSLSWEAGQIAFLEAESGQQVTVCANSLASKPPLMIMWAGSWKLHPFLQPLDFFPTTP